MEKYHIVSGVGVFFATLTVVEFRLGVRPAVSFRRGRGPTPNEDVVYVFQDNPKFP
jgi:hypothetical protein